MANAASTTARRRLTLVGVTTFVVALALAMFGGSTQPASADSTGLDRYIVVFNDEYALDNGYALPAEYALGAGYALGEGYALGAGYALYALDLINKNGGTVVLDLTREIGVAIVASKNQLFDEALRNYALVEEAGEDFGWKSFPSYAEAIGSGTLTLLDEGGGSPEPSADALETLQWDMAMMRTEQAHAVNAGWRSVDVGILDTGIDAAHVDFLDTDTTNVDCLRGRDFVVMGVGPGVGSPVPCVDNNFHGTHVAGIVAARANAHGVTGVAPNVTLVPIKTCDTEGWCYAATAVAAIAYAGSAQLDVANMSFFVDDDAFRVSTELKCDADPKQRAFRRAVERAIDYGRSQGVTYVAALGNSQRDLGSAEAGEACKVVPAEAPGVIGVSSLGPNTELAYYSSFGYGAADVTAPGGNFDRHPIAQFCSRQVTSTIPGNAWGCFQGTSMASPHAAGVAALIVSRFGTLGADGDVKMTPMKVEQIMEETAVDIQAADGTLVGYDHCFGNGRVDALRAVTRNTSPASATATAPMYDRGCPSTS